MDCAFYYTIWQQKTGGLLMLPVDGRRAILKLEKLHGIAEVEAAWARFIESDERRFGFRVFIRNYERYAPKPATEHGRSGAMAKGI